MGHVLFLIEFAFDKKPEPWDIIIFRSPPGRVTLDRFGTILSFDKGKTICVYRMDPATFLPARLPWSR